MQLAILHYHLESGGVAKVVHNHLLALGKLENPPFERVLLVHGGRAKGWPQEELSRELPFFCELLSVDGFDYDAPGAVADPELARQLSSKLRAAGAGAEETVLHWHNHSLGKNVSTPPAVAQLAAEGYRTLLQIHDFAEDFRPANYRHLIEGLANGNADRLPALLYPQATQIHYAALNGRDHEVLARAGVAADRLHLLPNPVATPSVAEDAAAARRAVASVLGLAVGERLLTYPVRGIRRKNVGELVLWSALVEQTKFFLTLAPQNPVERRSFQRWQEFVSEQQLPCMLGPPAGQALSFGEVLAASNALVTTSVAEGFGMVYLESWLAGKPLIGRNLPEITSDFADHGLDLDQLYAAVSIPSQWIDSQAVVAQVSAEVRQTYAAFGVEPPEATALGQQLSAILAEPTIDFARLPSKVQREVIRRVGDRSSDRTTLLQLNPGLQPESGESAAKVHANAVVVAEHYSLSTLSRQLERLYTTIWQSPVEPSVSALSNGTEVFHSLLSVERLHPIRVET